MVTWLKYSWRTVMLAGVSSLLTSGLGASDASASISSDTSLGVCPSRGTMRTARMELF